MMHEDSTNTNKKQLREFGLVMAAMFVVIFGLLFPWIWTLSYPVWPWVFAAVFGMTGLLMPMILKPVYILWMKLALVLGWINTRIILGFIFYSLIMPVGWFMKMLGHDPLKLKLDKSSDSYRVESKHASAKDMERPF